MANRWCVFTHVVLSHRVTKIFRRLYHYTNTTDVSTSFTFTATSTLSAQGRNGGVEPEIIVLICQRQDHPLTEKQHEHENEGF